MARYKYPVCGYVYDECQEGTAWEALPETGYVQAVVLTNLSSIASMMAL